MIELNSGNFDKEIKAGPIVVVFSATWCEPCKAYKPVLESMERVYYRKARIGLVEVDKTPALGARYMVQTVPTLVAFANGAIVDAAVGVQKRSRLSDMLDRAVSLQTIV